MKKIIPLVVALCAAGAWAANPKNPKPDWVDGSSAEFSRESFLTGVGTSDDRGAAEDRARGEISRIFSADVKVNTAAEAKEITRQSGAKDENSFSQSVANSVETVSRKILEGVEIRETWQDDASRVWYALAVLDKTKAVSSISDKIADFDGQVKQWYAQMAQAADKLPRVKAGMKLLAIFKARRALESDLRVLNGKGMPNPVDEAAVQALAARAVSELDVAVDVSGAKSREVETGVVKGLNGFGIQAVAGPARGPADIIVVGELETSPMETTEA
ncbi:MAG: LPP20 family lipoprotein, partial [Elusimicrobia bacterium]|nr:LPP20 family lipoprotein [Elusimicrobiota bacterium]